MQPILPTISDWSSFGPKMILSGQDIGLGLAYKLLAWFFSSSTNQDFLSQEYGFC